MANEACYSTFKVSDWTSGQERETSKLIGRDRHTFPLLDEILYRWNSGNYHVFLCMYLCPRSLDPFCIVSYFIKWVKPSWIYSIVFFSKKNLLN